MNNGSWLRAAGSLLPFIPSPLHLLFFSFPRLQLGRGRRASPFTLQELGLLGDIADCCQQPFSSCAW